MKSHKSHYQSTSIHRHSTEYATTLDLEVLALEPRRPFWEEADIDWERECIVRRGNRKPSLDDYDRWPLRICPLAGDGIRRNHFLGKVLP